MLLVINGVLAGAVLPMAFAPGNLWPLALVSPAMLLGSLMLSASVRQALLVGWSFGLSFWLSGLHWVYFSIHDFGGAPALIAALLTLGFAAGLALLQALMALNWYLLRSGRPVLDALKLFPACWLFWEWVRSWLLTGLPWLNLGAVSVDSWAAGWLPLVGEAGVGGLFAVLAGGLAVAVEGRLRTRLAVAGALVVFFAAGWLLQGVDWVEETGRRLDARLVQTNMSAFERWGRGGVRKSLEENMRLTGGGARLVLWPETSLPVRDDWEGVQKLVETLSDSFADRDQTLALGLLHVEDGAVYNSLRLEGADRGLYSKSRLVPFGEFTPALFRPLRQLFGFPASNLSAASPHPPPLLLDGVPLAVAICYEIAYGRLLLPRAAEAGLILTTSNDSWFGKSLGPWQHLQIARVRSAESRRWTLRSTNGGIGGAIDGRGQMQRTLRPFESAALTVSVPIVTGATPATLLPSWLWAVLALAAMSPAAVLRWRRRGAGRVAH